MSHCITRESRITAEREEMEQENGKLPGGTGVGRLDRVTRGVMVMTEKEVSNWHDGKGIDGSERIMGGRMLGNEEHW